MPLKEQRVAIISFDGLSADQFGSLLSQMPAIYSLLKDGNLTELDAAPFSDAQPIWAEILTGAPWYRNGCVGYATPLRSLTELKQFSESDLFLQAKLLPEVGKEQFNVSINVPLLEAREKRKWLADASSPTLKTVSPTSLLTDEPFKSYKPRPMISMGKAMADPLAASKFLNAESNRLECARALSKQGDWKLFLYRFSIFDQLAHLLGPSFLDDKLQISPALKRFLTTLDSVLYETIKSADNVLFMSAFSHTHCQEMFSLNDLFQNFQLLKRNCDLSQENSLRKQAFALINSEAAKPLVSASNQIFPGQTVCASPIRGAVYLNTTDHFVDGIVTAKDLNMYQERISDLLRAELEKISVTAVLTVNKVPKRQTPSFIVNTPGVDLVDSLGTIRRSYDLPHSVHDSRGFVWSKATNSKPIRSVEVIELVSELS